MWHAVFKLSFRTKKQPLSPMSLYCILWAVGSSGFSLGTQRGEGSESGSLGGGAFPLGEVAGLGAVVRRPSPTFSWSLPVFPPSLPPTALQRHHREALGGNSAGRGLPAPFTEVLLGGKPDRERPQVWHAQQVEREPTHSSSAVAGGRGWGGVAEQQPRGQEARVPLRFNDSSWGLRVQPLKSRLLPFDGCTMWEVGQDPKAFLRP